MSHVLIVENNEHQSTLYERELTEEGYTVCVAKDGRQAIAMAREYTPDVVVLDLHLQNMDGLDTLTGLFDIKRSLPIIVYTAYPAYQDSFVGWAVDAYLIKSSDLMPLKQEVARLLKCRSEISPQTMQGEQSDDRPINADSKPSPQRIGNQPGSRRRAPKSHAELQCA